MKEKLKNSLIMFSIFYITIITILMFITYVNAEDTIHFEVVDNFNETLNNYKEEASSITNIDCQKYVNNLIDYVEKTNYSGDVNIKDMFNNVYSEEILLSYYLKGKEACLQFTDENAKEYELPSMFITASIQNDEILQKYTTQYELIIKDNLVRLITEPQLVNTENNIKQNTELNIIKNIIEMVKENNESGSGLNEN